MILCQALFGEHLTIDSYTYFSHYFSSMVDPSSILITYLEYLVTLLKNKSSVFLYLQAVLEFQKCLPDTFIQHKLYDISFLARLIQDSDFFRLNTYSLQTLVALYELYLLVPDQAFLLDFHNVVRAWSSIMSPIECKTMCYFFSFRELKQICPFLV